MLGKIKLLEIVITKRRIRKKLVCPRCWKNIYLYNELKTLVKSIYSQIKWNNLYMTSPAVILTIITINIYNFRVMWPITIILVFMVIKINGTIHPIQNTIQTDETARFASNFDWHVNSMFFKILNVLYPSFCSNNLSL